MPNKNVIEGPMSARGRTLEPRSAGSRYRPSGHSDAKQQQTAKWQLTHAHTHACAHTHALTHTCTYALTGAHTCACVCTVTPARTHSHAHSHTCTHTCIHTDMHTHTPSHVHTLTRAHTLTHACIHTQSHIHMHTQLTLSAPTSASRPAARGQAHVFGRSRVLCAGRPARPACP